MATRESREVTRQEENFFLALFDKVVEIINNGRVPDSEIEESIRKIITYFRENRGPRSACANYNFSSLADFLGFFYRYSPLSAGITRNKTLDAINSCKELKECFNKSSLMVVNVGGGAGSDLVGLYSALHENSTFLEMEITLIDQYSEWREYFGQVNDLLRGGDFGNSSLLMKNRKMTTSFITADLRTEMTPDCADALQKADLVWMKGFLSTLEDDFMQSAVTMNIISSMVPGALLVVMDSPSYNRFDEFIDGNQLRNVFIQEEGRYNLSSISDSRYPISLSSNQEIFIFEKI
ncbi:uncharacterized protein LOC129988769 [Argiope bruennichi]|uniref:uncharacterized protein LOC129988769 n=1 Tax=Argiope bruennichi TaxID=94029 RepID=UPI002493FDB3|nr:uncharacterized protein LOC129988769 [Argiope bruennichi]